MPSPASDPTTTITINGSEQGPTFQGIGALSGGGGNSRFLIDYPAAVRQSILDYLFKPDYGASLQMLKLEIGGDANSSDGSEPSVEHSRDAINCGAGYEFWLARQAVALNPRIKLAGLQWAAPGWVSDGHGGLWSDADVRYVIDWMKCARSQGLNIAYLGGWNEHYLGGVAAEAAWFEALRRALDDDGFATTQIIAGDGGWSPITEDMAANPSLDRAIAIIGSHTNCGVPTPASSASQRLWRDAYRRRRGSRSGRPSSA
jgi:hypothetical protein